MNNNQPTADQLETLYPTRNLQDVKRLQPYANKTFYQKDPDNDFRYRTVYFRVNSFQNNRIDPMFSNYVFGEPISGMEELNPKLLQAVMRTRHLSNSPF